MATGPREMHGDGLSGAQREELTQMAAVTLRAAQAQALVSVAGLLREQAVMLGSQADAMEARARALTAAGSPEPEAEPEEEAEPAVEQIGDLLSAGGLDSRPGARQWRDEDGGLLSAEMYEFLERFNERFTSSPHFVVAVNTAAQECMPLDDGTARWIVGLIQKLEDEAAMAPGPKTTVPTLGADA